MSELPREELTEWMAYWQLEPFGSAFEEYRSALIASVVAEVNRNKKKRGRPFTPQEFTIEWGKDKAPQKPKSDKGMFDFIKGFQARMEVQAGVRSLDDIVGDQAPTILDAHGRPVK